MAGGRRDCSVCIRRAAASCCNTCGGCRRYMACVACAICALCAAAEDEAASCRSPASMYDGAYGMPAKWLACCIAAAAVSAAVVIPACTSAGRSLSCIRAREGKRRELCLFCRAGVLIKSKIKTRPLRRIHRLPSTTAGFWSTFDRLPYGCLLFMFRVLTPATPPPFIDYRFIVSRFGCTSYG